MPGNYNPYIPLTDAALDAWATNFDTVITAAPADYGLTAPQAVAFNILRAAFSAALLVTDTPATRTPVTIAAKDSARAAMVTSARSLARVALAYPSVLPADLTAAGLIVRNTVPTPIPAPATIPLLSFLSSVGLQMTVSFADELTPSKKYKPFGAVALQVFGKIDGAAPASIDECFLLGQTGRWPIKLTFQGADAGKHVYLIARWVTRRGLVGPVSATLDAVIQP